MQYGRGVVKIAMVAEGWITDVKKKELNIQRKFQENRRQKPPKLEKKKTDAHGTVFFPVKRELRALNEIKMKLDY